MQSVRPWWQLPTWTRSNECANLCFVLAALKEQYPESRTLATIVARHVAPCLRPPTLLAIHSESGICLHEEDNGAERAHMLGGLLVSTPMAFAPTCDRVAVATNGTVQVIDLYTGQLMMQCHVGADLIRSLAFSPTGRCLAAGLESGILIFVDTDTGAVQRSLLIGGPVGGLYYEGPIAPIIDLVYSGRDGRLAATLNVEHKYDNDDFVRYDDFVRVVDITAGSVLWTEMCTDCGGPCSIAYSPDSSLVVFSDDDGNLYFRDAETGDALPCPGFCGYAVSSLAFSPSGSHLAIGKEEVKLYLMNIEMFNRYDVFPEYQYLREISFGRSQMGLGELGEISCLAFSPNGLRLAAGAGCVLHILDTETCAELQTMRLSSNICGCFYLLPGCDSACSGQGGMLTVYDGNVGEGGCVIQHVDHPWIDPSASVPPWEATQIQDEMWASAVEARIAAAEPESGFLLLTFARQTQDLEQALLESPLARDAAWPVQPDWARGAKIFVNVEPHVLQAMLPQGHVLKPWHVLLREADEEALNAAIEHLPEPVRRLKCGIGRMMLYWQDADSVQANVDPEHMVAEVEVQRGFVHFSRTSDNRSTRTV